MGSRKTTLTFFILVLCLSIAHLCINNYWWSLNKTPLSWDQSNHAQIAVKLYQCLDTHGISVKCLKISKFYPWGTYLIANFFFLFTGPSLATLRFVAWLFFTLTLVAVFLFFNQATKQPLVAFLVAFLLSFNPVVSEVSRFFMTDLNVLAWVFFSWYFLLKSHHFQKRFFTILSFLCFALALLAKLQAIFYLATPYLFELWSMRKIVIRHFFTLGIKRIGLNLIMGGSLFSLLVLPWYVLNFKDMAATTLYWSRADASRPGSLFSLTSLTWYAMLAFRYQLFPFLFILMLVGMFLFLFQEKKRSWVWYASIYIIGEYGLLSLFGNKHIRYSFNILVFLLYFLVYLIVRAWHKSKLLGSLLFVLIFGFEIFMFTTLSFKWPIKELVIVKKIPVIGWTEMVNISRYPVDGVHTEIWPTESIYRDLINMGSEQKPIDLLVLVDYPFLHAINFDLNLAFNPSYLSRLHIHPVSVDEFKAEGLVPYLRKFNYVLVTNNQIGYDWHFDYLERIKIQDYVLNNLENYELVKKYHFPLDDLDSSIVNGTNLSSRPLNRKKVCEQRQCDEIILLQTK